MGKPGGGRDQGRAIKGQNLGLAAGTANDQREPSERGYFNTRKARQKAPEIYAAKRTGSSEKGKD